jgi:dolichol-phosphate mannosyltransferase
VIYICIPAYNEESTVGVLLWKIRQIMLEFPRDYQILVMDDGSTDGTAQTLAPYSRVLPLTVLRHEHRLGYARSLEELLREAVRRSPYPRRDVVVTMQADFTDDPAEIATLIRRIEAGADLVVSASTPPREAPRALRWGRRGLSYLLRRSPAPAPVTDPLSGFRAYRVVCLRKTLEQRNGGPLLTWNGWAANAQLLRLAAPHARRIDETAGAIRYDRLRRTTRFHPWSTLVEVLRFWWRGSGSAPLESTNVSAAEKAASTAGRSPQPEATSENAESGDASRPRGRTATNRRRRRRGPRSSAARRAQATPEAGSGPTGSPEPVEP